MSENDRRPEDGRTSDTDRPAEIVGDFHALRGEMRAAGRLPDFEAMMIRAREATAAEAGLTAAGGGAEADEAGEAGGARITGRSVIRLPRWAPLAAAAAVAALLLVGLPGDAEEQEFERLVASYSETAGTWRSPTASLMDIPGVDLGAVPSFGGAGGVPVPPGDEPVEGRDS